MIGTFEIVGPMLLATGLMAPTSAQVPSLAKAGRLPIPRDVEGALQWEEGRACRSLIDACLDERGNELYQLPNFIVSHLRCKRLGDRRSTCSFESTKVYGSGITGPRSRCTATMHVVEDVYGGAGWTIAPDSSRRNAALLRCN